PLPQHADSVFVEDTAVLVAEIAVATRPGAASRRGETATVAEALEQHMRVSAIAEPGCLDGGDVLHIERTLYVGASGRTNEAGMDQLARLLGPHGYRVEKVPFEGCLHLKSACSFIPPDVLLVNPAWVDSKRFGRLRMIAVDDGEPQAAN